MKKKIEKVVTFCCSDSVHVFYEGCDVSPMFPCDFHSSVKEAKEYLRMSGIKKPKVIENK